MLRSEMNACNEWVGAALYLLNSLMPAFGTRAMPVCSGTCGCGGRWGEEGSTETINHLQLFNLESRVKLVQ